MKKSGKTLNCNKCQSWYIAFLCAFIALNVLVSCDAQDSFPIDSENTTWHTAKLNCDLAFDDPASPIRSASPTYSAQNGDIIMLSFSNGSTQRAIAHGYAIYDSAQDSWALQYVGQLNSCSATLCSVAYVGNNPTANITDEETSITFNHHSPVFFCENGLYSFDGQDAISLSAILTPQTGRIRFQNNAETAIEVKASFETFDECHITDSHIWRSNSIVHNYVSLPLEISSCGDGFYSDYCYCLPYGDRGLRIKQGENIYRWTKPLDQLLAQGKAGLIQLPSVNSDNWVNDTYRVKNVSDMTISYGDTSGWTQTQSATRFYSNVGIFVELYYTVTYKNYYSYTGIPFIISISAYNEDGEHIRDWDWDDPYLDTNEEVYFNNLYYSEDAAYYQIQFYIYRMNVKITDFKISTF